MNITLWIIFTIFVFGPREPLILLVMYPAAQHNWPGVITVSLIFSLTVIATILAVVFVTLRGLNLVPMQKFER